MVKLCAITMAVVLALLPASSAMACSYAYAPVEIEPETIVSISHLGQPLPRVSVEVRTAGRHASRLLFRGSTERNGTLRLPRLQPGDYIASAYFLDVTVESSYVRVAERSSPLAKPRLEWEWASSPEIVRGVEGRLMDLSPPTLEILPNMIERVTNRDKLRAEAVTHPISFASLRLQSVKTGQIYFAASDSRGSYSFDGIPDGSYVLRIEGGISFNAYEPTVIVVRVDSSAGAVPINLKTLYPDFGICGYNGLVRDTPPAKSTTTSP